MNRNESDLAIPGIHHITAIAASAADNLDFYTRVLGLRLVKQTVNFDDPYTYHLYYGDQEGRPGTILTFFPWEAVSKGTPGAGMVTAIAFAVPRTAVDHWRRRLKDFGIQYRQTTRFDDPVIAFKDPHGLPLELIGTPPTAQPSTEPSTTSSPTAIAGFHSATILLNRMDATQTLLEEGMQMVLEREDGRRYRFGMQDRQSAGYWLDVVVDPAAAPGRPGSGTVHHIAFRTRNSREQRSWQDRLHQFNLAVTGVRDRKYFQSIYFREPGGVLFEIATDPPGFAVDEDPDHLGERLKLPSQYENLRNEIEARLPPLKAGEYKHIYLDGEASTDSRETFVALHGTGGSEHDLVPLVRQIDPTKPIISPRGNVLENGMPRFFERLADGVFDAATVERRAHALAAFLKNAAARYRRPQDGLTALGYSNGANIAAAVMLLHPEVFAGAVLLRPMLPLQPAVLPNLEGIPVLIVRGNHDAIIPGASTDQLVALLEQSGARVTVVRLDAGHAITPADLQAVQAWVKRETAAVHPTDALADALSA